MENFTQMARLILALVFLLKEMANCQQYPIAPGLQELQNYQRHLYNRQPQRVVPVRFIQPQPYGHQYSSYRSPVMYSPSTPKAAEIDWTQQSPCHRVTRQVEPYSPAIINEIEEQQINLPYITPRERQLVESSGYDYRYPEYYAGPWQYSSYYPQMPLSGSQYPYQQLFPSKVRMATEGAEENNMDLMTDDAARSARTYEQLPGLNPLPGVLSNINNGQFNPYRQPQFLLNPVYNTETSPLGYYPA